MKKPELNLKYLLTSFSLFLLVVQLSSCAIFFVPWKQKIQVETNNDSTSIYIQNEEHGIGKTNTMVLSDWFVDVSLKTNGYHTQHEILYPTKTKLWAMPLCIIDIAFVGTGIWELQHLPKVRSFNTINQFELLPKLITRCSEEKYIEIEPIRFKSNNTNIDVIYHTNEFNRKKSILENERIVDEQYAKNKTINEKNIAIETEAAKKRLNDQSFNVNKKELNYSNAVYKTLTETGFIDTLNEVFLDQNNTLLIEGVVTKKVYYNFTKSFKTMNRCKIQTTWYVKNTFKEKIDSVSIWSSSGSFNGSNLNYMDGDVMNRSLQEFLRSEAFIQYSKIDTNFNIQDAPLIINKPKNIVVEANDATLASVIIKRKDQGHGSGFAISNDGYILTNYHVIAGEYANRQVEFTVILSNGEEVKAQVVRFNKMRDVALLKVDATFEKAFDLQSEKTYKRLMNVYTVGTPKSIELGQSVSLGILSNERKANNNDLLQLNMNVNSGNSGGPLFDKQGVLHGIVTSKLVGANTEGVSFAIPSYKVAEYLNLK